MKIPRDFILGVATAAYQIEGNETGGAGKSHWDRFARQGGTFKGQDGAVACDHVQHWEQDLDLIADAGFDSYRFSFSWPRILPNGALNPQGLDFYDRLIDGMLERGLAPSATLYHWDMPLNLADKGGWENPDVADWLADFATIVADKFGDRLAQIATINEPWCVSWLSHFLGHHAPGKTDLRAGVHSLHNVLKAHGRATSALRAAGQKNVGIVLNMEYANPVSASDADKKAAAMHDGIYNRWFIEGLTKAAYPDDVMEHVSTHMPEGWQDDMAEISQPLDWLGLNYYTRTNHADDGTGQFPFGKIVAGGLPKTAMDWEIYPEGLSFFLHRLTNDYTGDLPLFVTENGMAGDDVLTNGSVDDPVRVEYVRRHLQATLDARSNGVPVQGYFAWSLMDNFEWAFGYEKQFGIVHVDYDSQKRTPKSSYNYLKDLSQNR